MYLISWRKVELERNAFFFFCDYFFINNLDQVN